MSSVPNATPGAGFVVTSLRLAVAALFVLPIAALVAGALRPLGPPATGIDLLPTAPTWSNFGAALEAVPLGRYALNSAIVALVAVPVSVGVASSSGFAIARLSRTRARVLVGVALAASMVPSTAMQVGRFWLYRSAGVTDTLVPLILPSLLATSPIFVLVYAFAFGRVPVELFDSAVSLGASPFETWRRVALPLVRPVTAVVVGLTFALTWGNAAEALAHVTDERWFTVPLALRALAAAPPTEQPVMLAGALLAFLPVVVVFALAQRWAAR